MRALRDLLLAGCFAFSLSAIAQKQAWIPITNQDLSVKEVPGNPGAPAIQLYYSQNINDRDENNEGEYIYRRIKRCESRFDGSQFSTQRVLKINGIFFLTEQYSQVRDFFSKVQYGDEQQAVLQGGSVDAQN